MNRILVTIAFLAALTVSGCGMTLAVHADSDGLWDAHTHLSWYGEKALDQLAASGVVAVRDCGSNVKPLKQWREEIASGRRKGPTIYFSGPALDGPKDSSYRMVVTTPEEARHAVDTLAQLGVDFIKTHNAIPRDAYFAVLDQARRRGLRVASHLPKGIPAWEAADAGVGSIEHAAESLLVSPIYAGYAKDANEAMAWWKSPEGDAAIAHLAKSGVAVTPTLVTYEAFTEKRRGTPAYEPRRRALAFLIELTGRLHRKGVMLLAGSDFASLDVPLVPGTSLLREVELLQQAGLTRSDALAAAGTNVSLWIRPKQSDRAK
jgi:imidazolonepropionase-like amidohydrolase